MRILQVVSTPPFAWATGGCARVVFEISRELASMGHDVSLVTTRMFEQGRPYTIGTTLDSIDGVKVFRYMHVCDKLAWRKKIYISPGMVLHLKKHAREYDVVHLQDFISVHAIATRWYCRREGVPYVLTTHGSANWMSGNTLTELLFARFFGYALLRDAASIIALNSTEASLLRSLRIDPRIVSVVPNGTRMMARDEVGGTFRKSKNIREEERIILYIGRMHESKGLNVLIESLSLIAAQRNDIKLVLVGPDDGYLSKIEHAVKKLALDNKVIHLDYVSEADKECVLSESDVFVTPKFTGFPLAFLEACAYGLPIVTTNNGDQLDWIHNQAGLVVDYDAKSLCEGILNILSDDTIRARYSENARRLVQERFNWREVAKAVESIYERAIINGSTGRKSVSWEA